MPISEPGATAENMESSAAQRLILRQPDDWHVHLRDGAMLAAVVNETARQFARAIVMPNLDPPVTTVARRKRIASASRLPSRRVSPSRH